MVISYDSLKILEKKCEKSIELWVEGYKCDNQCDFVILIKQYSSLNKNFYEHLRETQRTIKLYHSLPSLFCQPKHGYNKIKLWFKLN